MKNIFIALTFLISGFVFSQETIDAQLLELNFQGESRPKNLLTFHDNIYFTADDGVHGRELWTIDSEAPKLVIDINEASTDSFDDQSLFLITDDYIYFTTSESNKLWRSDGTEQGTELVIDNPESDYPTISNLIEFNSEIFLSYNDSVHGFELWKIDGSPTGLNLVKDINPGSNNSGVLDFFVFNNHLYFTADDGVHGREIWKTDGTSESTIILKDIYPNYADGVAINSNFIALGNHFYFYANSQLDGRELWKTDGTESGTQMVKDINPGWASSNNINDSFLGAAGEGFIVFRAFTPNSGYELWKSDGTEAGTYLLKEINPNGGSFGDGIPGPDWGGSFINFNDKIYFNAEQDYQKLWVTDGTPSGTTQFLDLNPGTDEIYEDYKIENGKLYFYDCRKIIQTDGVTSEVFVNIEDCGISQYIPFQDKVYFENTFSNFYGDELWVSEFNNEDIRVLDVNMTNSSRTRNFANFGDKVVFFGFNYAGYEVPMISNGTPEGTKSILDSPPFRVDNNYAAKLFHSGDNMFFMATNNQNNWELYKTNGTPEGTGLVKDLTGDSGQGLIREIYANYNDILYFVGNDNLTGYELYRSDGSEEGTYKVTDLVSGADNSPFIYSLEVSQNYLYFSGGLGSWEVFTPTVWKSDGTDAGTQQVIQFQQGVWADRALILKSIENNIFIYKNNYPESYSIYVSNGDQESLLLLRNFEGNSEGGIKIEHATEYQNKLYFVQSGRNLYVSDGTISGTHLVTENLEFNSVYDLFVCGEYLYFREGADYGSNLWRTDGSPEGTIKLKEDGDDFQQYMSNFTCFNSNVLFTNGINWSNQIFITKGESNDLFSAEILTNDNYNFGDYEGISSLFVNQDKLYLTINTRKHGDELYVASPEFLLSSEEINEGLTNKNSKFLIYPNPTSSEINIVSTDKSKIQQIQLYDLTGKLLELGMYNSKEVKLNLSKYSAGIYLVKVKTEKNTSTQKVILK